ncbi:hypothetical protein D8674_024958 [Pyrus ussuriensis x Pyrus communis]|uniref:Uncharacterized protein n=1 Tax=Pyrus ussuriensis x Pyrus communis TaxID=2448454 RepID=A0A5N5H4C7_9ROSA|nr:hypothetical protein D8674_024958 [Pyrus ussuriensis x Pyrus communis]
MGDSGACLLKTTDSEEQHASLWSYVGALLRTKCDADWDSWRAIPEELKMHMIDELVAIDNMFKLRFREWKFDNQHAIELQQESELPANE